MATTGAVALGLVKSGVNKIIEIHDKSGKDMVNVLCSYERPNAKEGRYDLVKTAGFGLFAPTDPGQPVRSDIKRKLFETQYYPIKFAKIFNYTVEDEMFDLYNKAVADTKEFARVYIATKNLSAANLYNNGFTTAIYDEQYLFDTDHVNAPGVAASSNLLTLALSPTALQTAVIALHNQTDERGLKLNLNGAMNLYVPNALWPLAWELTQSGGKPQTADNDKNFNSFINAIRIPDLSSSTSYFLRMANDDQHGMRFIDFGQGLKFMDGSNNSTLTKSTTGYMLYMPACFDWHGIVGKS